MGDRKKSAFDSSSISFKFNVGEEHLEELTVPSKDHASEHKDERERSPDLECDRDTSPIKDYLSRLGIRGRNKKLPTVEEKSQEMENEHSQKADEIKRMMSGDYQRKHSCSDTDDVETINPTQDRSECSSDIDDRSIGSEVDKLEDINREIEMKQLLSAESYGKNPKQLYTLEVKEGININDRHMNMKEVEDAVEAMELFDTEKVTPSVVAKFATFCDGQLFRPLKRIFSYRKCILVLLIALIWTYYETPTAMFVLGILITLFVQPCIKQISDIIGFGTKQDGNKMYSNNAAIPIFDPVLDFRSLLPKFARAAIHEGWVNELSCEYSPDMYHYSLTQSVHLKLQGSRLCISEPRNKVPKRALWNEPNLKLLFNKQRLYDISNCVVQLLPEGLVNKRKWSKKYPICVRINKNSFIGIRYRDANKATIEETALWKEPNYITDVKHYIRPARTEVNNGLDNKVEQGIMIDNDSDVKEIEVESESIFRSNSVEQFLFFFTRTDREKELWFRRLSSAVACKGSKHEAKNAENAKKELEQKDYLDLMVKLRQEKVHVVTDSCKEEKAEIKEEIVDVDRGVMWVNVLVGRLLHDCVRNDVFLNKIQHKLQLKLNTIKLPRFMESLNVRNMEFGEIIPIINKAAKPIINDKGIWIDLHVTFNGLFRIAIDTKLNLMKLKREKSLTDESSESNLSPTTEFIYNAIRKGAIYDSDVEDSAETSADESDLKYLTESTASGGSGGGSPSPVATNKMLRIVDKFASSKFFESMTENRYVKRMMEGVSNTDLTLFVEMRGLSGTLVFNIPPPPTDRIWYGFRENPQLRLYAYPKIGIYTFELISKWIQKKLVKEFEKVLVLPNMDDLILPGLMKT